MMRMPSGIFIGLAASVAFAVACADSGTDDTIDDMTDDDMQSDNVCGDAVCAAAEVGYCQADCGQGGNNNVQCGNGMCETTSGESNATCSADCPPAGGGSGSGSGSGSATGCPSDPLECFACMIDASLCIAPLDQATCQACLGGGGGGGLGDDSNCEGGAPDGTCSAAENADPFTCITDCLQ